MSRHIRPVAPPAAQGGAANTQSADGGRYWPWNALGEAQEYRARDLASPAPLIQDAELDEAFEFDALEDCPAVANVAAVYDFAAPDPGAPVIANVAAVYDFALAAMTDQ